MKKFIPLIIILLVFAGCEKKKEEITVLREDQKETTDISDNKPTETESNQSTSKKVKEENESKKHNDDLIRIGSAEAKEHIGANAEVTGKIAGVVVREKVAYLNFDKKYPNNTFTAVIFKNDFEKFGDLEKYNGKTITVKGRISEYRSKPQIILNSPSQIKSSDK